MRTFKKIAETTALAALAGMSALNYAVFVFPNSFAPSGIDGICTMIQDISKVSMGYLSLLANIPLLIAAFILLSREFALKSTVYVLAFSFATLIFRYTDISRLIYHTDTGTSIVLAPIAAGAVRGILYSLTLRLGGCSGGIDIIAAILKKLRPHLNFMNSVFAINLGIALSSYFVYGLKAEPVICSIIYAFITSSTGNNLRAGRNDTVKFEIITTDAQALCNEILSRLDTPATIIDAKGAYLGTDRKMVICVTEKQKAPYLEDLIHTFSDVVVFKSIVNN